jgi:hypothetical protein
MDCNHKYYVCGVILCSGEKAEHVTKMFTNSWKYIEDLYGELPRDGAWKDIICKADLSSVLKLGVRTASEILNLRIKIQKCQRHVMKALKK